MLRDSISRSSSLSSLPTEDGFDGGDVAAGRGCANAPLAGTSTHAISIEVLDQLRSSSSLLHSEPIRKRKRVNIPWRSVPVPKGMPETLWSEGEPPPVTHHWNSPGVTSRDVVHGLRDDPNPPSRSRRNAIPSSKFAKVLRLVAGLSCPQHEWPRRFHGPIPQPPVWAEVCDHANVTTPKCPEVQDKAGLLLIAVTTRTLRGTTILSSIPSWSVL